MAKSLDSAEATVKVDPEVLAAGADPVVEGSADPAVEVVSAGADLAEAAVVVLVAADSVADPVAAHVEAPAGQILATGGASNPIQIPAS